MKNLSFALISALYATFVMRVFTVTKSFETILVFSIAASPILALALRIQGKRIRQKRYEDTSPYPWLSLAAALAASIALIMFVIRFVKKDDLIQFFGDYILGWSSNDAFAILAISLVMAASGASIWTSYRFRSSQSPFIREEAPYVFYAGASEKTRLAIYIYSFAVLWSIGVATHAALWNRGIVDESAFIRMSRAAIPLAAILVIALARLPFMALGALASLGGVWYVVSQNFGASRAAATVGVPVAFAIAYIAFSSVALAAVHKNMKPAETASAGGSAPEQSAADTEPAGGEEK